MPGFRSLHTRYYALVVCAFASLLSSGCATAPAPQPTASIEPEVLRIIRENPKLILDTVTQYQAGQLEAEQKAALQSQREALAKLDFKALIADSPIQGAANGHVTLVSFSDFQCPFCQKSLATVHEFMQKHGTDVTLVFKHLPLSDIHPKAESAARAAWAAYRQGKFWEYHDALFARQRELGEPLYLELAATLKLDVARFKQDFASPAAHQAIQKDVAWAQQFGVNATPHFLLGRTSISGAMPLASFEKALQEELAEK